MQNQVIAQYLTKNGKYIRESSAAALEQISDVSWPAILAALNELSGGATDPGIDCDVVITHETLDDFEAARANHWSERGLRSEIDCNGVPAVKYDRFQIRRGQPRRSQIVLDFGDKRVSLL